MLAVVELRLPPAVERALEHALDGVATVVRLAWWDGFFRGAACVALAVLVLWMILRRDRG